MAAGQCAAGLGWGSHTPLWGCGATGWTGEGGDGQKLPHLRADSRWLSGRVDTVLRCVSPPNPAVLSAARPGPSLLFRIPAGDPGAAALGGVVGAGIPSGTPRLEPRVEIELPMEPKNPPGGLSAGAPLAAGTWPCGVGESPCGTGESPCAGDTPALLLLPAGEVPAPVGLCPRAGERGPVPRLFGGSPAAPWRDSASIPRSFRKAPPPPSFGPKSRSRSLGLLRRAAGSPRSGTLDAIMGSCMSLPGSPRGRLQHGSMAPPQLSRCSFPGSASPRLPAPRAGPPLRVAQYDRFAGP